jgi:hypothetical protein
MCMSYRSQRAGSHDGGARSITVWRSCIRHQHGSTSQKHSSLLQNITVANKKLASPDVRLELTALGLKVPRANPILHQFLHSTRLSHRTHNCASRAEKEGMSPARLELAALGCLLESSHSVMTMRPT